MMTFIKRNYAKCVCALVGAYLSVGEILAQQKQKTINDLGTEINTTTRGLTEIFDNILSLVMVISGIAAVIGVVQIAKKYFNNEQDATKSLTGWCGGVIALTALCALIKAFMIQK